MTVKSLVYKYAWTVKIIRIITPSQEVYTYDKTTEILNSPYFHNTVLKVDYQFNSHLDLYITE